MQSLTVSHHTAVSAAGLGNQAHWESLLTRRSGLALNDLPHVSLVTHIGRVRGLEDLPLPPAFSTWDSRNNRLALLALRQDGLEASGIAPT